MDGILDRLEGGDRRSIGRADEVVEEVLSNPSLFGVVFSGMLSDDALIRMRSADVVEKVTAKHPEYLEPFKAELIGRVAEIEQQEVRWHVAQMVPRLGLTGEELVFEEVAIGTSGSHHLQGVFLASGGPIRAGSRVGPESDSQQLKKDIASASRRIRIDIRGRLFKNIRCFRWVCGRVLF